jgi:acetyl-CoA carboxylase carboxyltransferase component
MDNLAKEKQQAKVDHCAMSKNEAHRARADRVWKTRTAALRADLRSRIEEWMADPDSLVLEYNTLYTPYMHFEVVEVFDELMVEMGRGKRWRLECSSLFYFCCVPYAIVIRFV